MPERKLLQNIRVKLMNSSDNAAQSAVQTPSLGVLWLSSGWWNLASIALLILGAGFIAEPAQANSAAAHLYSASGATSPDSTVPAETVPAEAVQIEGVQAETARSVDEMNLLMPDASAQSASTSLASSAGNVDAALTIPEQIRINTEVTDAETEASGAEASETTAPALFDSVVYSEKTYVINSTQAQITQAGQVDRNVQNFFQETQLSNRLRQILPTELLSEKYVMSTDSSVFSDATPIAQSAPIAVEPSLAAAPNAIAAVPPAAVSPAAMTGAAVSTALTEELPVAVSGGSLLAQTTDSSADATPLESRDVLGVPYIRLQGVYLLQGDESSARARVTGFYAVTPSLGFGAEVDLTTGDAFADSRNEGLNINELYATASLPNLPNLRFVGGLMDLTSYFDRNSFAKDGTLHFFNPVFQTNPALSATAIASRPGLLANWSITDNLEVRAATFSSSRDLDEFELDAFAGEVAFRFGNAIVRGTYVSAQDADSNDGFQEIFQIDRGSGEFGLQTDDREDAFGLNAEVFVPSLNLGLFGRYGRYENRDVDEGGDTFSFGFNLLDLFLPDDRLGLAYGRVLSNDELRRDRDDEVPDVVELFYDIRVARNLRAGVTVQALDQFSETIAGFRVRTEFDASELGRLFR
jgi:hypothetical protein